MPRQRKLSPDDDLLRRDYQLLVDTFTCHREAECGREAVIRRLNNMCSESQQKDYRDKLLHIAVKLLVVKMKTLMYTRRLSEEQCPFEMRTWHKEYVIVIQLIAKDANLSYVDEEGRKPVDHLFQELLNSNIIYTTVHNVYHQLKNPRPRDLDHDNELMLQVLSSLINQNILNSPVNSSYISRYISGYSYFSALVLMGMWKLVEWGLDSGADVSDNGVCRYIPMDAVFVHRYFKKSIERKLFERLIHPTNVNRPLFKGSDKEVPTLHMLLEKHYGVDFIGALLNAGACVDVRNKDNELPMDIYTESLEPNMDPQMLRLLVPKSVGISPTLFLKCLISWRSLISRQVMSNDRLENVKALMMSTFCQYLMLSSGWQELSLHDTVISTDGDFLMAPSNFSFFSTEFILATLKKLGIRALCMPAFESQNLKDFNVHSTARDSSLHIHYQIQKKWNEHRNFIPSLPQQCVRVIRSSLQVVTEEKVQILPIPKCMQEMISLKPLMEELYQELSGSSEQLSGSSEELSGSSE